MQASHPRYHLGIFGGSGSGKTTYARKFITGVGAECVFIFDPEGEFSTGLKLPHVGTCDQLDAAIRSGWVCFDPQVMFEGDNDAGIDYFAKLAFQASGLMPGRKLFVVDELGDYMTTSEVPKSLRTVLQKGRRHGLDGVFIAQQPNELHNRVRFQLSEVVCFQFTDETALEYPKRFGFDPEAVKVLAPFQFICRNNRGVEVRG